MPSSSAAKRCRLRPFVGALVAVSLGSLALPPTPAALLAHQFAAAEVTIASAGSAYTAVSPMRLLDTRASGATLGPNGELELTVTGGAVPSDATAVVLNVTATDTSAASYLSVFPAGSTRPVVSNLNWVAGQTVPNLVTVPVGTGGQVTFYNYAGQADVIADLEGYYAPAAQGSSVGSYVPLGPTRITDTRAGSGYPNAGGTLAAGAVLNVQATGAGGVPTAGVEAVVINVTVTNTTANSYLTAYPAGEARPLASNLNWTDGETVANRVIVPLSSSGQLSLYNYLGQADVVVDVDGYFGDGSYTAAGAALFNPVIPVRILDTRQTGGALAAGATITQQLAGLDGISTQATAVVGNITATSTSAAGFFTVFPGGVMPTASDVNWQAGETAANLTVASLSSSGSVSVYNFSGTADLIIDAFGYFTPLPSSGANTTPSTVQSANWSGYEVADGPYTAVAGTFTVPNLASSSSATATAEWVGIDGASNTDLIQAGVGENYDPSSNLVTVYPWWEILPASETPISMTVSPGDSVTVRINQVGGSQWAIDLTDNTTGQSFSTEQTYSGPLDSAEWIVEAPTQEPAGTISTLGPYSPDVVFSGLGTNGAVTSETEVIMQQGGADVSVPSQLTQTGFAVAYGSNAPPPP